MGGCLFIVVFGIFTAAVTARRKLWSEAVNPLALLVPRQSCSLGLDIPGEDCQGRD